MTREFPDELLSAYLDGELLPAERDQVEQQLAASEPHRQLLAELKSLRSDVAALPPVAVNPDFADRVVRAAVAEAEKHDSATADTSLPPPTASRRKRRAWMGVAAVGAGFVAACWLLVIQLGRKSESPGIVGSPPAALPIVAAADPILKSLYEAAPAEGEAVVLRLRVGKDMPIADALSAGANKAGLAPLAANMPTGAAGIAAVYGGALEAKYQGSQEKNSLIDATAAAAQALFIEAPVEQLEAALRQVADGMKHPLELDATTKLAFTRPKIESGEGEFSGKATQVLAAGQPFAQQLDAARFRLEKKLVQAATAARSATAKQYDPKQIVRVLLLVEVE